MQNLRKTENEAKSLKMNEPTQEFIDYLWIVVFNRNGGKHCKCIILVSQSSKKKIRVSYWWTENIIFLFLAPLQLMKQCRCATTVFILHKQQILSPNKVV